MPSATYTPRRDGALFRREGDFLVPGVLTRGPWYHDTLHGSAMLAAMAQAAERHPSTVERQVVRLTVDMMRAAPMVPPFHHPGAEQPAFHHAIDVHVDLQTSVVWFRLAVPVVEGEPTTGFVTVATIADWTYAAPHLLRTAAGETPAVERTMFAINADTTLNGHRPLSGRWVGLRTTAHVGGLGAGTSGAHLFDEAGPLGFTTQSVLVRGPSGAPLSVKEFSG